MAKLTRYLQKIFANNSNEVGVFGTGVDKETSKNVETLQSADYENGWSSAIITNKNYPIWQEMDGVQYGLSYQLKYLFQSGIPEWLSTETYYANTSFCQYGGKIYQSLQDNNTNHNPALDDGYWTPLLTSNRSIGEIITSTLPLTEAGLHLLDGALISSGMYADFVTYMANLTATAPEVFCSEADWQTAVTTYGVCDKFVYDSVNNTVRLPKYGNQLVTDATMPSTAPVKGNGMTLGFTNGTQNGGLYQISTGGTFLESSPTLYGTNVGTASDNGLMSQFKSLGVTTDSTKSGIIADLSGVSLNASDVYYYICIATSTKTDIQVDIDEIATDLNGKADVDLSNINPSQSVKNTIVGWGMPDYTSGISYSYGVDSTEKTYTMPSDGVLYISGYAYGVSTSAITLKINGYDIDFLTAWGSTMYTGTCITLLVNKNDIVSYKGKDGSNLTRIYFYPMKGVN